MMRVLYLQRNLVIVVEMFALDAVTQTVAVGAEENPGKMNVMLVVLVITNQTRTVGNGEDHPTVSEMVDLEPEGADVLEGKDSIEFFLFITA